MSFKSSKTILIVDDDPGVAKLQRRRLERAGFHTITAASAAEALKAAAEHEMHLALLDFRLPGEQTGLDLFGWFKEAGYTFPVVLVTGYSDEETAVKALRAGVRDFVTKSAEYLDYLPEVVERVLRQTRLEAALRDSEARFRVLTDVSPQIVWEAQRDGRLVYCSHRWYEFSGFSEAESMGDGWLEAVAPAHRDQALAAWTEAVASGHGKDAEILLRRADGQFRWHLIRGVAMRDETGNIEKWIGVAVDIHDRKAAEAALREKEAQLHQAQKLEAVGQLAGGVAHEYNNLLQAILGCASFALETLSPDNAARDEVLQIQAVAERARRLTQQLLGLSRRQVLQRIELDLNEQLQELLKMLRPLLGADIEVRTQLSLDAAAVDADPALLQQLLLNLCVNARDAMPSGGRLTLETQKVALSNRDYVLLTVSDTGMGMSSEVKARLFEPFFTTKEVGQGTGLGLAMVYGVVQQHGGKIDVESEPGEGATFRIYLPRAETALPQQVTKPNTASVSGGQEMILVADDEPIVRNIAVRALQRAGYAVLTAEDGVEALRLFEAHAAEISLALLDAVMPVSGGAEISRRIRLLNPTLPIVLCSGNDPSARGVESAIQDGAIFLQKPFDLQTLLRAVRETLDARTPKLPREESQGTSRDALGGVMP